MRLSALVCSAILLWSARACGEPWAAYTSENFTLYSDAAEEEVLATLERFEIFRLTTLSVLGLPDEPTARHPLIVLYGDARDFGRVSPGRAAGFFYSSIFGPRMLVRPLKASEVRYVLFHEYVHYLLHARSTRNYPRWYDEGLAQLLGTVAISDTSIRVGDAPQYYKRALELGYDALLRDVIELDARADSSFYLTAWLMTHYFMMSDSERRAQTSDYLRRYDAGEDPIEAFTASYGMPPAGMDREISAYARRRTLPALISGRVAYEGALSKRVLSAGEALFLLADIAVERDTFDAAHRYFDQAEELQTESPFRERLRGRRAIAYIHERRVAEGDRLISPLLEQSTADASVLADIAHYFYDRFVEIRMQRLEGDEAAMLDRAVAYGTRAVATDPQNLEAHYYLGLSYEARGELQSAVDALLVGYDIDPSTPRLNLDLSRVLILGRQYTLASYVVSRVTSATHSDETRAALRAVIADLEDNEIDLAQHELLLPSWQRPQRD